MRHPVKDCSCEDFPCCEHADNFPDTEPEYCDLCGAHGHSPLDCAWGYDEPEPDEYDPGPEVDDEGGMSEFKAAAWLGEES